MRKAQRKTKKPIPVDMADCAFSTPKKLTPTERKIDLAASRAYTQGRQVELELWQTREKEMKRQLEEGKVEQLKAVTALINATTANLSKAGYLIAKLNGGSGW